MELFQALIPRVKLIEINYVINYLHAESILQITQELTYFQTF